MLSLKIKNPGKVAINSPRFQPGENRCREFTVRGGILEND
jgi:hypothetical protein